MNGSDLLDLLPCKAGPQREEAILDAVKQGQYVEICWWPLTTHHQGHVGTVFVSMDALRLGEPYDYFRPNVTAATAQRIADELGCLLPTTKIVDLVYRQATARIAPCLQPADRQERLLKRLPTCPDGTSTMSDTPAMVLHSKTLSEKRSAEVGLICNVGKHWVITNRLLHKAASTAANYGWFEDKAPYRSASGFKLWQPLSTMHNDAHVDYSQVLRLVRDTMVVDGVERSVMEVGSDPELSGLISDEGIVKVWRQRSVPRPGDPEPPQSDPLPADTDELAFDRMLKLQDPRMTGEDVRLWQRFLRISPDSIFGPQTHAATRAWQGDHGLYPDGIVGPRTLAAANVVLRERAENHDGAERALVDDFVEARNYTKKDRSSSISLVVIHTAEIAETLTAAEALASWAAGPHAPKASWHYAVDADSIVQSVHDEYVAWHAPGANKTGIGIELAGRARQTEEEWRDEYSQDVLARAARLVSHLCQKWDLPIRFVDREGLKKGHQGITTHNEVSMAFHKSDHTDPGKHFPMDDFLKAIRSS